MNCRGRAFRRRAGDGLDREYWDRIGGGLEGRTSHLDPFLGRLKREAYLKLVRQWAPVQMCGTVLKTDLFEEAFGGDALVPGLVEMAELVVGFDISSRIVRIADAKIETNKRFFTAGDTRKLPFPDESFDLIVSPSTLDHFEDRADLGRSLRELGRVLKPSGRLIISLDNRQNIGDPLLRAVNRLGWIPFYLGKSYTVTELRNELREAGFGVSETTAILHNPRLFAVGCIALARKLQFKTLQSLAERLILAMQSLGNTRLRYYTGSFVVALAARSDQ